MQKIKNSGFNLIELLVVVTILAILGIVSMPSYGQYQREARRSDAKNSLVKVQLKLEQFYAESATNNYPTSTEYAAAAFSGPTASDSGYYSITYTPNPTTSPTAYTLTATALGTQLSGDTDCKKFIITNLGVKTSENSSAALTTAICWF